MGCDIHPYAEVRRDGKWERVLFKVPRDRNYHTFAILADVRNGSGFAGVKTGDQWTPISQPRGLPEDRATFDSGENIHYEDPSYVWLGDHSYSWLTLSELQAYDLSGNYRTSGVINKKQEAELKEGKTPESWCGGKWPMTEDDVHAEWDLPAKSAASLLPKIIAALEPLGSPEDVRIVFGFDS